MLHSIGAVTDTRLAPERPPIRAEPFAGVVCEEPKSTNSSRQQGLPRQQRASIDTATTPARASMTDDLSNCPNEDEGSEKHAQHDHPGPLGFPEHRSHAEEPTRNGTSRGAQDQDSMRQIGKEGRSRDSDVHHVEEPPAEQHEEGYCETHGPGAKARPRGAHQAGPSSRAVSSGHVLSVRPVIQFGPSSHDSQAMDPFYDRLSALDTIFLDLETETVPMHVGAALVFDAKPLMLEHGGLDIERIRRHTLCALESIPRYRQRLAWVPGLNHPVWVDDDRFNIDFHLRHTRLPLPGDERMLKRVVGRLFSQRLDRSRPLWEFWIVEGVENDRFAFVCKAHHCMVDGVAGVGLLQELLQLAPPGPEREPQAWRPRPAPTRAQLLRDEIVHRIRGLRELSHYAPRFRKDFGGLVGVLRSGMELGPETPFTAADISPYRRFDWTTFDVDDVKKIKNSLGGTLNDVVLATTTSAIRSFLRVRNVDVDTLKDFRAFLPVNIRKPGGGSIGNQVAMLLAELPIAEPDPIERLQKIIAVTVALKKESNQPAGAQLLEDVANLTTRRLILGVSRAAIQRRAYSVVVTNVPGPPFQLHLLGAPMQRIYPLVPIPPTQNLGIALFSYDGKLCWGFNADWERFPEVHEFVEHLEAAFHEYEHLADTNEQVANDYAGRSP